MKEITLSEAISKSWHSLSFRDHQRENGSNLDLWRLKNDLTLSPNQSGAIVLLQDNGNYELTKYAKPELPVPDITFEDLWICTKEHFGLTAATAALAYGGMPIRKIKKGTAPTLDPANTPIK